MAEDRRYLGVRFWAIVGMAWLWLAGIGWGQSGVVVADMRAEVGSGGAISGLAVDRAGNLFVARGYYGSPLQHRVWKVNTAGQHLVLAGSGVQGYGGNGGPATAAQLDRPTEVDVDDAGNVYIADTYNRAIRKVDTSGIITTVAGMGPTYAGYNGDGIQATAAKLNEPMSVAVDGAGNFYIADQYNHRIRRVDAQTRIITTVAGNGTRGNSGDGGPATSARIANPTNVAVDREGNIYIADYSNSQVRKVTASTGIITTVVSGISRPLGVFVDEAKNLFVTTEGSLLLKVTSAGVKTTVGQGFLPWGIDMDRAGNIYVADVWNACIRRFDGLGVPPPSNNHPPVAPPQSATVSEDGSVAITLNASDVDGDPLTYALAGQPAHGSVALNGNVATYTPVSNYHGPDSFSYTVNDGRGGTATATVSITVTSVNDPPVAMADEASTLENAAVRIEVLANDTDVEGDPLTVAGVTQGTHGAVVVDGNGVIYTPQVGYHGPDGFSYTVSDGQGGTATATVSITVTPVEILVAVPDTLVASGSICGCRCGWRILREGVSSRRRCSWPTIGTC